MSIRLVDTHSHLNFVDYDSDLKEVILRAKKAGVSKIIVLSSEHVSAQRAVEISQKYLHIYAAIGVHPLYLTGAGSLFTEDGSPQGFYTKSDDQPVNIFYIKDFEELLRNAEVKAIGEVGLDYFESADRENPINRELQMEVLEKMLNLAVKFKKPAIVHLRTSKKSTDAFDDFLEIVNRLDKKPKVVVHCFSGDKVIAKKLLDAGFYISFTNLTFYSEKTKEAFIKIPLSNVMLETDSPFLSPKKDVKRNEPAFLKDVAQKLADLRNMSLEELAAITTKNAEEFFGI
jgi:TatD DNase family protein